MDSIRLTSFTIRQILVLTCWLVFGFASVMNGGYYLTVFVAASFVAITALAAHALSARHPASSFSRAFLFAFLLYFGIVALMGEHSWDPIDNRWPGAWLTEPLYEAVVDREWVDQQTQEVLTDADPRRKMAFVYGDFAMARLMSPRESPERFEFMLSLHLVLGIILAAVPGRYALSVAVRLYPRADGEPSMAP